MTKIPNKKIKCPICKRKVPETWIVETDIPTVVKGKKLKKGIKARLAECCATLYLDSKDVFDGH